MRLGRSGTRLVADVSVMCSTTTLYHLLDSLRESPSGTALLNFGDLSYAGKLAALTAGRHFLRVHGICTLAF